MRSKISDKERLLHILDAIDSIINFTNELSYQQYNDDFKLRLALIKLLEIIGEAANGISDETQGRFSEVEFASIETIYPLAPDNAVIGH
ncbi:MAG: HepT-like ribonuclease domain-containing protein [Bacteroidota bacterium]